MLPRCPTAHLAPVGSSSGLRDVGDLERPAPPFGGPVAQGLPVLAGVETGHRGRNLLSCAESHMWSGPQGTLTASLLTEGIGCCEDGETPKSKRRAYGSTDVHGLLPRRLTRTGLPPSAIDLMHRDDLSVNTPHAESLLEASAQLQ